MRGVIDLNQDRLARIEADLRDKARREELARMNGAHARGFAEGEARGEARDRKLGAQETALNFLEMGLDPVSVSKGTGLPLEDVLALVRKPQ